MNFLERAQYTASKGVPVIRLRPNSKAAMDTGWPELATTDNSVLERWNLESPDSNCGAVAQAHANGFWFLEVDAPEVVKRIEEETGKKIPNTFRVRSRIGRGHFYWKQTPASLAMGNLSQSYVKHGDWSARVDAAYVVTAKSLHPHSQQPYVQLQDEPINPAPDWLVEWLISQKVEKKSAFPVSDIPTDAHGLIPHGFIHGWMLTQAGKLRNQGLSVELIEAALMELVHAHCAPPIDDDKVRAMAKSVAAYPPGQSTDLLMTQTAPLVVAQPVLPVFEDQPYPKFPRWVMEGTSLYRNFVKPVCDQNSRIDYFMWIPAMAVLLNYVGPKIRIKGPFGERPFKGSQYMVLIGRKGKSNKSSSVGDAMEYFNYCGLLQYNSRDLKNAEGKIVTWTVGSPEGLGLQMQKCNCRNALMYYDELSKLVNKAGIETSALTSDLLTMYEAKSFGNAIKAGRDTFSLDPDTYCTSLIACTTDKKFAELWSKLAGEDTGLDDRFFFVLQPKPLPAPRLQEYVNTLPGSAETRVLIDKAIMQGKFEIEAQGDARMMELVNMEPRFAARAEKWAVGLAIDLGLDVVDGECIERAAAIVKYEIAVKKWLKSYEATTREGQIQQDIRRTLEMNGGRMGKRELMRDLHSDRHGTSLWNQSYTGLSRNGIIREEGVGSPGDPVIVQLLIKREFNEDE